MSNAQSYTGPDQGISLLLKQKFELIISIDQFKFFLLRRYIVNCLFSTEREEWRKLQLNFFRLTHQGISD